MLPSIEEIKHTIADFVKQKIYWLLLEIMTLQSIHNDVDFRKQHSIVGHLIAQEIGRQTPHRPTENCQKVKVSFGKTRAIFSLPHVNVFSRRPPLNTSPHNQQMLHGKSKNPHFHGQSCWANWMVKGKIRDRAQKPLPKKTNLGEGSLEIIG